MSLRDYFLEDDTSDDEWLEGQHADGWNDSAVIDEPDYDEDEEEYDD